MCVLTVMAFIIVLMGGDYFHCMHCVITIALSLTQVAVGCIGRCVVLVVAPTAVFLKPSLHDQLCRLSPCRQSTEDIIGEAFRRQTGDLNKYSCIQLSCGGGEFRVQRKQMSFMCHLICCSS